MAMLVELSRSGPAWPLLIADAPALPCQFPVSARPTSAPGADEYGADEHGPDEHGADEYGADEYGADEYGADEYGAGSQGVGIRRVKDHHEIDQNGDDGSELDFRPLRAAVMAACSKRPLDPGFAEWLREVARNLDNSTD